MSNHGGVAMFFGIKVKVKPIIPRLKQFFICCNSGNITIEDKEEELLYPKKKKKGDCEQGDSSYNQIVKNDLL